MSDSVVVAVPHLQTFAYEKARAEQRRQGFTYTDLGMRCGRSGAAIRDYLVGRA